MRTGAAAESFAPPTPVPAGAASPGARPPFPPFPEADDPIARWARLAPARTALVDDARDELVSYAALDAMTARWAAALARRGAGAGDRVALLAATHA
jgi:hypothetical protein